MSRSSTRRPLLIFAAAALLLAVLAGTGSAYWDDVHFDLTYYLSRLVGYTPEQALRIAAVDLSIDYCATTEPVQPKGFEQTEEMQAPRWKFHAFRKAPGAGHDVTGNGDRTDIDDQMVIARRQELFLYGVTARNPGIHLHFFQDELPHLGYGSEFGHAPLLPEQSAELADSGLHIGGRGDWLSAHPREEVLTLAKAWAVSLLAFMKEISPSQYRERGRMPTDEQIAKVVDGLRAANAAPEALTADENSSYLFWRIGMGQPPDERRGKLFEIYRDGPAMRGVMNSVRGLMTDAGMVEMGPKGGGLPPHGPARKAFVFDEEGKVLETGSSGLDAMALAGDLTVKVAEQIDSRGQPFYVVVRAPPTMAQEKEALLVRTEMPSVRPGDTVKFDQIPVGEVVLEAVREGKVLARQERVKILARKNRTVLGLPKWILPETSPTVTWSENSLGWVIPAGFPKFDPDSFPTTRTDDLMAGPSFTRPIGKSASLRWVSAVSRSGEETSLQIDVTERRITVTVEEKTRAASAGCTWVIDLSKGRPPEETWGGDVIEFEATGQVSVNGIPPLGAGTALTLSVVETLSDTPKLADSRLVIGLESAGKSTIKVPITTGTRVTDRATLSLRLETPFGFVVPIVYEFQQERSPTNR